MNAERDPVLKSPAKAATRRPRIALMGEFSAGKSTLANLLLGESVSPVKVTATQLPPVWFSHGPRAILRIDETGGESEISAEELQSVSHLDTQAVRIRLESEVLEFCDVIDMPGTSDPNMQQDIWARFLDGVDGVVWCTPSTQAWRQTEAAMWEQVPERLHHHSLLLITRMDMLANETDRNRVLARVQREAGGLFHAILPISLTEALSDRDSLEVLERSGADQFFANLVGLVESFGTLSADDAPIRFDAPPVKAPVKAPVEAPAAEPSEEAATPANVVPMQSKPVMPGRVAPRRVRVVRARPAQS